MSWPVSDHVFRCGPSTRCFVRGVVRVTFGRWVEFRVRNDLQQSLVVGLCAVAASEVGEGECLSVIEERDESACLRRCHLLHVPGHLVENLLRKELSFYLLGVGIVLWVGFAKIRFFVVRLDVKDVHENSRQQETGC